MQYGMNTVCVALWTKQNLVSSSPQTVAIRMLLAFAGNFSQSEELGTFNGIVTKGLRILNAPSNLMSVEVVYAI